MTLEVGDSSISVEEEAPEYRTAEGLSVSANSRTLLLTAVNRVLAAHGLEQV